MEVKESARTVVFVCLHGAAKSVVAAAYLQRLAEKRGVSIRAPPAGIDPDPEVSPKVVQALLNEGIDIRSVRPRRVTREDLTTAWRVVVLGCDLGDIPRPTMAVVRWDDIPPVGDGFAAARDAIVARVRRLLEECER